jgi:glycerophosphoryl diester phosphodiesterase
MLKIGHRGACGYEPENTLLSFKKALELGVEMIEFDVHRLKSGEIVVFHDDKLDRTTNGKGYISDKTFDEIRILDAGKGKKIPTLEEVLDLVDRKAKVNIELKGKNTGKTTAETINNFIEIKGWRREDFLVSSSLRSELQDFIRMNTGVKIGIVVNHTSVGILGLILRIPFGFQKFASQVNASFISFSRWFLKKRYVAEAHKKGQKVFVFTINRRNDADRAKSFGVDGIFTNYPDKF